MPNPGFARRRAPRWGTPLICVSLASAGSGCVFHPPPPLPEELEAQKEAEEARKAAARGGSPAEPDPENGPGSGEELTFAEGDQAPVGMTREQIRAYAKAQGDPLAGEFPLEAALEGLPASGTLVARFHTQRGVLTCELFEDQAPLTVANFVGLARGKRPFKDGKTGEWRTGAYYDGVKFHRVIPGFMVQTGDPLGTGLGNAGYVIEDEIRPELIHEGPGTLSMANRGPGTGSSQFFITLGPAHHLDGKHTIFGQCDEPSIGLADDISMVPRGPSDKPDEDELIDRVEIARQ